MPNEIKAMLKRCPNKIVSTAPDGITEAFVGLTKRLDMKYRFHDLRHYYASVLLSLNVPNRYAAEMMGHATDDMLRKVYQHTMRDKQDEIAKQVSKYFNTTEKTTKKSRAQ